MGRVLERSGEGLVQHLPGGTEEIIKTSVSTADVPTVI